LVRAEHVEVGSHLIRLRQSQLPIQVQRLVQFLLCPGRVADLLVSVARAVVGTGPFVAVGPAVESVGTQAMQDRWADLTAPVKGKWCSAMFETDTKGRLGRQTRTLDPNHQADGVDRWVFHRPRATTFHSMTTGSPLKVEFQDFLAESCGMTE
jgi:hypothetical protein